MKHEAWIAAQRFDDLALDATFAHYRATMSAREAAVGSIESDLARWFTKAPFSDPVARLCAYRGITQLGALNLAAVVCDWRRFATAGTFIAFCGLTPSEHSSGERTRRGHITLRRQRPICAPSWSNRRGRTNPAPRSVSNCDDARKDSTPPSWPGRGPPRLRLCGRFRRLDERKTNRNIVVVSSGRK